MNRDKKKMEDGEVLAFRGLEKSTVLQEARIFSDSQLNPRRCCHLLTKILYLLNQGETFTPQEATGVFFGVTKLFQSKDATLRRMVYLTIKEFTRVSPDEVLIVTSSLMKDTTSTIDLFRANALRVLSRTTDNTMLGQIDRFFKQAIVDKNHFVASSALVSAVYLFRHNQEIVKRWVNEVQDALSNSAQMVQYHALAAIYLIKQHDRLAVTKMVTGLSRNQLKSPLAHCLLIRYAARLLNERVDSNTNRALYEYLESCLRHKNEMVVYEAARSICSLRHISPRELSPAITVLQLFLTSQKPALRFGAVRTLNQVVSHSPLLVTTCQVDLENLISDSNRSIATLAITTLLKTGVDSNVERLMKQISSFMSEIADEFKIVMVEAIQSLCLRFPHKHKVLMNFLSSVLREEGGYEYKKAIVDSILILINEIQEAKEAGLTHFCEFIEDCEFTQLSVRILHVLGKEGPRTFDPSRYIRFIYNRVILEKPPVRAAAVSALGRFGASVPSLRPSILILLRRCLNDNNDEVRDRATLYLHLLTDSNAEPTEEGPDSEHLKTIVQPLPVGVHGLEQALIQYSADPSVPFTFDQVPPEEEAAPSGGAGAAHRHAQQQHRHHHDHDFDSKTPGGAMGSAAAAAGGANGEMADNPYLTLLNGYPQLAHLGPLFNSSRPIEVTEPETEYTVNCIKHIFSGHVVLQFNVINTLEDQLLEQAHVELAMDEAEGWQVESVIAAPRLPCQVPGVTLVCIARPPEALTSGTINAKLRFNVKSVDPNAPNEPLDDGFEDEYPLEDIEVVENDYVKKLVPGMDTPSFRAQWEQLGADNEVSKRYILSISSLHEAIDSVVDYLGMQPTERADSLPSNAQSHALNLFGLFLGDIPVFVRAGMVLDAARGLTLTIAARSPNPQVSEFVASSIR